MKSHRRLEYFIASYVLYHLYLLFTHWTVSLNVNQYMNTARNSSWLLRLTGTAWLMPLCLISCAFQNGFDIFKTLIRNGPWPVLSSELCQGIAQWNASWHVGMYQTHVRWEVVGASVIVHYWQRRVMGHKCTTREPPKPISLYTFSPVICCAHGCFHTIVWRSIGVWIILTGLIKRTVMTICKSICAALTQWYFNG